VETRVAINIAPLSGLYLCRMVEV